MARFSDGQIPLCLTMHVFHFPMNRISYTKCLFFSLKSCRHMKIPLSVTTLGLQRKPVHLSGIRLFGSLWDHLFVCCLSHGANQPAAGQTCLMLQTHSAVSASLSCNRSSYQNLKLPLQSTRVRPDSTALVQKKEDSPQATSKQVISKHGAWEEGGSTVLLLSTHFSTISSNQPATQEYPRGTVERS